MSFLSIKYHKNSKPGIILLIFSLFVLTSAVVSAQVKKEAVPPLRERLFFGGNLGLQFGTITNIQVAPVVGLWVRPRIAVAAGPEYQYFKFKDPYGDGYESHSFGGKAYAEFVVIQNINKFLPMGANTGIFLHLEDELLSLHQSTVSEKVTVNTILGGAGLSQQIGRRSSVNLMFLWVLDDSGYPLYSNPEIRISFSF
jgi:hypothetical protein